MSDATKRSILRWIHLIVVGHEDPMQRQGKIVPYGCAARNLVHSPARIPHATVQIIPVRCGTRNVFIHQRSKKVRTSPGAWDILGGHVAFEMALLSSPSSLSEASMTTALREAREEMLLKVDGKPYLIQQKDFKQVGEVGQFTCDEPKNVEYSTAFVLCIPNRAVVSDSPFEYRDGTVEWLPVSEIRWDDLLNNYKVKKSAEFADGISRILEHALISVDIEHIIDQC